MTKIETRGDGDRAVRSKKLDDRRRNRERFVGLDIGETSRADKSKRA
jgi:hypothetical protein